MLAPLLALTLAAGPQLRLELGTHAGPVIGVAADESRDLLLTLGDDQTLRTWVISSGLPVRTIALPVEPGAVSPLLAVAPLLHLAAISGPATDGTSGVWLVDYTSGALYRRLPVQGEVTALAMRPDTGEVAVGLPTGLQVFSAVGTEVVRDAAWPGAVTALGFAPDGSLAAGGAQGLIRTYDRHFGRLAQDAIPAAHPDQGEQPPEVLSVRYSPDGKQLAVSASGFDPTQVRDAADLRLLYRPVHELNGSILEWSSDGRELLAPVARYGEQVAPEKRCVLARVEARPDGATREQPTDCAINGLTPLSGGAYAYASWDGVWSVRFASGATRVSRAAPILHFSEFYGAAAHEARSLRFDPSGTMLRVLDRSATSARVLSLALTERLFAEHDDPRFSAGEELNGLEVGWYGIGAPDKRRAAGVEWAGHLRRLNILDTRRNPMVRLAQALAPTAFEGLAWSRDGRLVAGTHADGVVRLYRAADGQLLLSVYLAPDLKRWVMWTPGGYWDGTPGAEALLRGFVDQGPEALAQRLPLEQAGATASAEVVRQVLWMFDEGKAVRRARGEQVEPEPAVALKALAPLSAIPVSPRLELVPQRGHDSAVDALALSRDGALLLSGSADTTVRLWDLRTRQLLRVLAGHEEPVLAVALSPDGRFAASGGGLEARPLFFGQRRGVDFDIRIWDLESGAMVKRLPGHADRVRALAFAPDGTHLASAGADGVVALWDLDTAEQQATFALPGAQGVAWGPGGLVALGKERLVRLGTEGGKLLDQGGLNGGGFAAVSPDGRRAAVLGPNATLLVVEVATARTLATCAEAAGQGGARRPGTVAFSSDGLRLAAGNGTDVRLFDAGTGQLLAEHAAEGEVQAVVADPGSVLIGSGHARLFSVDSHPDSAALALWDPRGWQPLAEEAPQQLAVAFAPDGQRLVSGGSDGAVRLWDLGSASLARTLRNTGDRVLSVAVAPDGRSAASVDAKGMVTTWDLGSGAQLGATQAKDARSVAYAPDGRWLLLGNGEVLDAASLARLRSLGGSVTALSPDGSLAAMDLLRDYLDVKRAADGAPVARARPPGMKEGKTDDDERSALAFLDGARLASADGDGHVRVWDARRGAVLQDLPAHAGATRALAALPGGRLASAGDDGRVRVWDLGRGAAQDLLGHRFGVTALAASPDGAYLASASKDGTLRLWRLADGASLNFAAAGPEWLAFTDDGYFDASRLGGRLVAAVVGRRGYHVDQLAVRSNRPDLLLARVGLGAPELRAHYLARHRLRLQRLGLGLGADEPQGGLTAAPRAEISGLSVNGNTASLTLRFDAGDASLRGYNVFVNGVPLYGPQGKPLAGDHAELIEAVELVPGHDKLEVSATGADGTESLRAYRELDLAQPEPSDLYFVGLGVSRYRNRALDLKYADKDVLDLAAVVEQMKGPFAHVQVKTFVNKQANVASLAKARAFLQQARPNDLVVVFVAGHGVYADDAEAEYYFLTYEADPAHLAKTAAPFREIEGLLQELAPRRKLLLIDTCESGERDPEQAEQAVAQAGARGVKSRGFKKAVAGAPRPALPRAFLFERDRFIYNDLARRTGAVVLSASTGAELSYEADAIRNGAFTEAVLKALTDPAADRDGDGKLSPDELRAYVAADVERFTKGLQHPVIDRDNLDAHIALPVVPAARWVSERPSAER